MGSSTNSRGPSAILLKIPICIGMTKRTGERTFEAMISLITGYRTDEIFLAALKRKMLRRTFGPICVEGDWSRHHNEKLWADHVIIHIKTYTSKSI